MYNNRQHYTILKMSQVFGVSRSGYYSWLGREPSQRETESNRLKDRIKQIWKDSYKSYGSPRIHQKLLEEEESVSRPRVARLMKKMGIQSCRQAQWTVTTDSAHSLPTAPNLLDRRFTDWELGQAWVSDITYLPSRQGWLYLTTVIDLADRQVIGWALSESLKAEQTSLKAFSKACRRRPPGRELLMHSDRGVQYACEDFRELLSTHDVTQSMSRKGNCWDNAPAESFFKTFKSELPTRTDNMSYQQVRSVVFEYIERWYNSKRLHSSLNYRAPREMQQILTQQQKLAA